MFEYFSWFFFLILVEGVEIVLSLVFVVLEVCVWVCGLINGICIVLVNYLFVFVFLVVGENDWDKLIV